MKAIVTDTIDETTKILKKFIAYNSKPNADTFPELPKVLTWIRMIIAVAYGYNLGTHETYGFVGLVYGVNAICFLPLFYCSVYLRADSESYGSKLFFVGVPNSMALMTLIWVYYFTLKNEEEENIIRSLLVSKDGQFGSENSDIYENIQAQSDPIVQKGSEYAADAGDYMDTHEQQEDQPPLVEESEF